jgi:hypothetical protein
MLNKANIKEKSIQFFVLCFMIFNLMSCAGYRFRTKKNPFEDNGIRSISIPMFLNKSSLPNVAGVFTREYMLLLNQFPDLTVHSGDDHPSDGILLGIISSPPKYSETVTASGTKLNNGNFPDRRIFEVPNKNLIQLTVRLVLIKNPGHGKIPLYLSTLGEIMANDPQVIFNQSFPISSEVVLEAADKGPAGSIGETNFTRNKGSIEKNLSEMAKTSANNFKEMILYAF